jgi:hypothetical protein
MTAWEIDLSTFHVAAGLPAAATAVTGLLKVLPGTVTAVRRRGSEHGRDPMLRVTGLAAAGPILPAWAERYYPSVWADPDREETRRAAREPMQAATQTICAGAAWLVALVTVAYFGLAALIGLPTWSWVLAAVLGGTAAISLYRMYRRVKTEKRATAAIPRSGQVVVTGDLDHVRQQCLVALVGLGAKVVVVERDRLLACTGVRFFKPQLFLGEVIWVTLSRTGGCAHRVEIVSVKVDYVSRSRSAKNVARFLEAWATHPTPVA